MHSLEELNAQVVEHNTHRKHFERTSDELALQIQEEATELVAEVTRSLLTGEVVNVVGEVGDLYILLAQFCDQLGINPVHAMQMKFARNAQKYDDNIMNNGYTREEAVSLSKRMWKAKGGDQSFAELYLDYIAQEED